MDSRLRSPAGPLALLVIAQLLRSANTVATQPSDFIWQLRDIDAYRPTGNPSLGYQNLTWCCIKAVAESLEVVDGQLLVLPDHSDWIILPDGNASALIDEGGGSQFPCTAVYAPGDDEGAPVVQVPYTWRLEFCPGWQLSDRTNLNAWLQPLSGFLLPAVIFCLSIPRRRKLRIPGGLFADDINRTSSYPIAVINAIRAGFMVLADTIIWLSLCFAFAGPMIISGLYEALLDSRMLEFVQGKVNNLTLDMRCRILMVILIGNLDLAIDEDKSLCQHPPNNHQHAPHLRELLSPTEPSSLARGTTPPPTSGESGRRRSQFNTSQSQTSSTRRDSTEDTNPETMAVRGPSESTGGLPGSNAAGPVCQMDRRSGHILPAEQINKHRASPWEHMEELLYRIRLYDDDNPSRNLSPRQKPRNCQEEKDQLEQRRSEMENHIGEIKTKLRTMLLCQYSFGSTVGAPVLFFLGGFIFALLQSLAALGDENVALGLAFGQWYMIIPHIAIVSGLLLAGNNPNILEGVLGKARNLEQDNKPTSLGFYFELAYPSCYRVAWQWKRGPNKRAWINKLIETYHESSNVQFQGATAGKGFIGQLQDDTRLTIEDWILRIIMTFILLGVPFGLALMTAYNTPEIGVSCRSLTFLIYACVQFAQILLWLWAHASSPPDITKDDGSQQISQQISQPVSEPISQQPSQQSWLRKSGFYNPTAMKHLMGEDQKFDLHKLLKRVKSGTLQGKVRLLKPLGSTGGDLTSQSEVLEQHSWSFGIAWFLIWHIIAFLLLLFAVFTAIGGTLMQLIGVYSVAVCRVTVNDWSKHADQRGLSIISVNSALAIKSAKKYWKWGAITAIGFMAFVSFLGWWYQRRMRLRFTELVEKVDEGFPWAITKRSRMTMALRPTTM